MRVFRASGTLSRFTVALCGGKLATWIASRVRKPDYCTFDEIDAQRSGYYDTASTRVSEQVLRRWAAIDDHQGDHMATKANGPRKGIHDGGKNRRVASTMAVDAAVRIMKFARASREI